MAKSIVFYLPIFALFGLFQTILPSDQIHQGVSFRLIHHDDPKSPTYQPNLTTEERMDRLVQMSNTRALYLNTLLNKEYKNSSSFPYITPQAIRPSIRSSSIEYMVQVGIGTFQGQMPGVRPFEEYLLILDTASDNIWTACEGAQICRRHKELCFPRSQSSTFKPYPCMKCPSYTACKRDHCTIQRNYLDGSIMKGIVANETLTFSSDDQRRSVSIPNLIFTCAIDIKGSISDMTPTNRISGIFGMNREPLSFMKQVEQVYGGKFSYCLQHHDQAGGSPMFLRFGADIPQVPGLHSTPFLTQGGDSVYRVQLEDISVGSRRLELGFNTLNYEAKDAIGGCIVDTGSTFSYIAKEAYERFEGALVKHIKTNNPNLKKVTCPWKSFRLCYKRIAQGGQQLPTITFHFANNADFLVPPEGYMHSLSYKSQEMIRMEILPDKLTVLGVKMQANYRMIYDIRNSQLLFAQQDCSVGS